MYIYIYIISYAIILINAEIWEYCYLEVVVNNMMNPHSRTRQHNTYM